jgi:hypothetical protein
MIDTSGTFRLGYVMATVLYVAYLLWLWRRARRVDKRLRTTADPSLREG